jgi:hypothetical protein
MHCRNDLNSSILSNIISILHLKFFRYAIMPNLKPDLKSAIRDEQNDVHFIAFYTCKKYEKKIVLNFSISTSYKIRTILFVSIKIKITIFVWVNLGKLKFITILQYTSFYILKRLFDFLLLHKATLILIIL